MRILELGKFYPPHRGGMETLLQLWCEGFVGLGAQVDCVVANDCPRSTEETIHGVPVRRLASYGTIASTSMCPAYLGAAMRSHADIWHMHAPNPLADIACLRGRRDVPLVVSYHSDVIRQRSLMGVYRPLLESLLRRADVIVAATPNHIEYSRWLGAHRDKCRVIPFGIPLDRYHSTPELESRAMARKASAGGRPVLLTVGRLVGYKGIRHLIEAMRLVDAVLWIVGTGPLEGELKMQANGLYLGDRVVFLGEVAETDLPCVLHACDVFVLPSVTPNEAFGIVQIEAMACGRPVVSCDLKSGVPWVNQHEKTGLVVPPADADALAVAINRLLQDAPTRVAMGTAGRQRAAQEFDQRVMIQRYWDLFASLLARAGSTNDV